MEEWERRVGMWVRNERTGMSGNKDQRNNVLCRCLDARSGLPLASLRSLHHYMFSKCKQSSFSIHTGTMCCQRVHYEVGFKWAVLWLRGKCQQFSAGNLHHKNVTVGHRENQYGSRGRRQKVGGKERGMLPQVKNKMTAAKGEEGGGGRRQEEVTEGRSPFW